MHRSNISVHRYAERRSFWKITKQTRKHCSLWCIRSIICYFESARKGSVRDQFQNVTNRWRSSASKMPSRKNSSWESFTTVSWIEYVVLLILQSICQKARIFPTWKIQKSKFNVLESPWFMRTIFFELKTFARKYTQRHEFAGLSRGRLIIASKKNQCRIFIRNLSGKTTTSGSATTKIIAELWWISKAKKTFRN